MSIFAEGVQRQREQLEEARAIRHNQNRGTLVVNNPFLDTRNDRPVMQQVIPEVNKPVFADKKRASIKSDPLALLEHNDNILKNIDKAPIVASPMDGLSKGWGGPLGSALHGAATFVSQGAGFVSAGEDISINFTKEQAKTREKFEQLNLAKKQRDEDLAKLAVEQKNGNVTALQIKDYKAQYDRFIATKELTSEELKIMDSEVTPGGMRGLATKVPGSRAKNFPSVYAARDAEVAALKRFEDKAGTYDGDVDNMFGSGRLKDKRAEARFNRDSDKEIRNSTDSFMGALGAVGNAANANKDYVVDSAAQSLIYVSPLGMAAALTDAAASAIDSKKKMLESEGRISYLDEEDQIRNDIGNAVYGAVNLVGTAALQKVGGKVVSKAFNKAAGGATTSASAFGAKAVDAIKNPLTKQGVRAATEGGKKTAKTVGLYGGLAVASGTDEVIQDSAQKFAAGVDLQDQTNQDRATSFILGATGGAGVVGVSSAGGTVAGHVAKSRNERMDSNKYRDSKVSEKKVQDVNSKHYDPSSVIRRRVKALKGGVHTEADRQATLAEIANVEARVEETKKTIAEQGKASSKTTRELATDKSELANNIEKLKAKDTPLTPEERTELIARNKELKVSIKSNEALAKTQVPPAELKKTFDRIMDKSARVDAEAVKARTEIASFEVDTAARTERLRARGKITDAEADKFLAENASGTPKDAKGIVFGDRDETKQSPIERIKNKFLRSPSSNSDINVTDLESAAKEAETLGDVDTAKALRTLSKAIQLENKAKGIDNVSNDIMVGTDPNKKGQSYKGLAQYTQDAEGALNRGSIKDYNKIMNSLGKFETSHASKAAAVKEAASNANSNDPTRNNKNKVVRIEGTQNWEVVDKTLSDNARLKTGSLIVHKDKAGKDNSSRLINAIEAEAAAITARREALQEMGNQYTGKTSVPASNSTPAPVKETTDPTVAEAVVEAPVAETETTESAPVTETTAEAGVPTSTEGQANSNEKAAPLDNGLKATEQRKLKKYNTKVDGKPQVLDQVSNKEFTAGYRDDNNQATEKAMKGRNKNPENAKAIEQDQQNTEAMVQGITRYIGFGAANTKEGSIRRGVIGASNIITNFPNAKYEADDVVLYYYQNEVKNGKAVDIKNSTAEDAAETRKARWLELKSAIEAEATIRLPTQTVRDKRIDHAHLRDVAKLLEQRGYTEETATVMGKPNVGTGVFKFTGEVAVLPEIATAPLEAPAVSGAGIKLSLGNTAKGNYAEHLQGKANQSHGFIGYGPEGSLANTIAIQYNAAGRNVNGNYQKGDIYLVEATDSSEASYVADTIEGVKDALDAGSFIILTNPNVSRIEDNTAQLTIADSLLNNNKYMSVLPHGNNATIGFKLNPNFEIEYAQQEYAQNVESSSEVPLWFNDIVGTHEAPVEYVRDMSEFDSLIAPLTELVGTHKAVSQGIQKGLHENEWSHVEVPTLEAPLYVGQGPIQSIRDSVILGQKAGVLTENADLVSTVIATKDMEAIAELAGIELDGITNQNVRQLDAYLRIFEIFKEAVPRAMAGIQYKDSENPLKRLMNENNELNENTIAAMAVAAYQQIQSDGHATGIFDDKSLLSIYNLDKNTTISNGFRNKFRYFGSKRDFVGQTMGKAVVSNLGLYTKKDARVIEDSLLETSIGNLLIHVMTQSKGDSLLTMTTMSNHTFLKQLVTTIPTREAVKEVRKYVPDFDNDTKNPVTANNIEAMVNSLNTAQYPDLNKQMHFVRSAISKELKVFDKSTRETSTIPSVYQPNVLDILKATTVTDNSVDLIDAVFKTNREKSVPSLVPVEFTQKKIKGGGKITKAQRKLMEKIALDPWTIHKGNADSFLALYDTDPNLAYQFAGIGLKSDFKDMHDTLAEQMTAEWNVNRRAIDDKINWLRSMRDEETGQYKEYYQMPVVWINNRFGYESTLFNAQANKFDRILSGKATWATTIDPKEGTHTLGENGETIPTTYGSYLKAIAESLEGLVDGFTYTEDGSNYNGLSTADKIEGKDFYPKFLDKLANDVQLNEMLDMAQKIQNQETLSNEDYKTFRSYVESMDTGVSAMHGLFELVSLREAIKTGSKFTTTAAADSDGVTNGPLITQISLGVANNGMLEMGGMLTDDGESSYFSSRRNGQEDYYQSLGSAQNQMLASYIPSGSRLYPLAQAAKNLVSKFGTRSGSKVAAAPFNYGAGDALIRRTESSAALENREARYYAAFGKGLNHQEGLDNFNDETRIAVENYNNLFTSVLPDGSTRFFNKANFDAEISELVYLSNLASKTFISFNDADGVARSSEELQDRLIELHGAKNINGVHFKLRTAKFHTEFKPFTLEDVVKAYPTKYDNIIRSNIDVTLGVVTSQTLRQEAKDFIEMRDELTDIANETFSIFDNTRNKMIEDAGLTHSTITKGQMDAIEKELHPYKPMIISAMGSLEGTLQEQLDSGIPVSDTSNEVIPGERMTSKFQHLDPSKARGNKEGNTTTTISSGVQRVMEVAPAVRSLALIIQAMDAYVASIVTAAFDSMNMHDSTSFGLKNFIEGVQAQNKAFLDAVVNYHVPIEFNNALLRSVEGVHTQLLKENKDPKNTSRLHRKLAQEMLGKVYTKGGNEVSFLQYLLNNSNSVYDATITKLEGLAKVKVVHQYAGEGGQYVMTEKDVADINKLVEAYKAEKMSERVRILNMHSDIVAAIKVRDGDSSAAVDYIKLAQINTTDSAQVLMSKLADGKPTNISRIKLYLKAALTELGTDKAKEMFKVFEALDDTLVGNVRVEMVDNIEGAYYYDRLNDRLLINSAANPTAMTVARAVMIATMHKNALPYKKGSGKNKAITNEYAKIAAISSNIGNFVNQAVKDGSITALEAKVINDTLGKHKGDVEYTMDFVMNNTKGMNILSKISMYEGDTKKETILDKVRAFISALILNSTTNPAVSNLSDILFTATGRALEATMVKRNDKTISDLITESFSTHKIGFHDEIATGTSFLETRINHELLRAKINGKSSKGIPAKHVLRILKRSLLQMQVAESTERNMSDIYLPVIDTLNTLLDKGTSLIIVENAKDLVNLELTADKENALQNGDAFYDIDTKTVYLVSAEASAKSHGSMLTLIHELVHAATEQQLDKDTPAVRSMAALYQSLVPAMQEHPSANVRNASLNLKEFVAEAISSPTMIDFLQAATYGADTKSENAHETFLNGWSKALEITGDTRDGLTAFTNIFASLAQEIPQREPLIGNFRAFDIKTNEIKAAVHEARMRNPTFEGTQKLTSLTTTDVKKEAVAALRELSKDIQNHAFVEQYNESNDTNYTSVQELVVAITESTPEAAKARYKLLTTISKETGSTLDMDLFNAFDIKGLPEGANQLLVALDMANQILRSPNHAPQELHGNPGAIPKTLFTASEVFKHLSDKSGVTDPELHGLVLSVIEPLIENIDPNLLAGYQLDSVWEDAVNSGQIVFASDAMNSGYMLNDQQSFVLELLEATLANTFDSVNDTAPYRKAVEAYQDAARSITVEDFHTGNWSEATNDEKELAHRKYDFIFTLANNAEQKSEYLSRFMAISMVSPEVKALLNVRATKQEVPTTWYSDALSFTQDILSKFYNAQASVKVTDTISDKTTKLARDIANVYKKHNDTAQIVRGSAINRAEERLEEFTNNSIDRAFKLVEAVGNSPLLRNTPLGPLTQAKALKNLDQLGNLISNYEDSRNPNNPLGPLREISNEIMGTDSIPVTNSIKELLALSKRDESVRQTITAEIAKMVRGAFHEDNHNMTPETMKQVTTVILRTDLQLIRENHGFARVMELIGNRKELDSEIRKLEKVVMREESGSIMLIRAKDLANYMLTNKAQSAMLVKSAYGIANKLGLQTDAPQASKELVNTIDELTSLYALRNTKAEDKAAILDIHAKEQGTENGLDVLLSQDANGVREANDNFKDNPWSQVKGYVPAITNTKRGFKIIDAKDRHDYELQGYEFHTTIIKDPSDLNQSDQLLMYYRHTGKQGYLSGALSVQDTHTSGQTVFTKFDEEFYSIRQEYTKDFVKYANGTNFVEHSGQKGNNYMIPSYDDRGNIISFSYEMSGVLQDTLLERNNDFSQLVGTKIAGANYSAKAINQNAKIISKLIEIADDMYGKARDMLVEISPTAPTRKGRESWHQLPKAAQLQIEREMGSKSILVRNDHINLLFGYSKYRPSDLIEKADGERNIAEQVINNITRALFKDKAALRMNQGIDEWMEGIKTLKSFEVVRNFTVFKVNVLTNVAFSLVNSFEPVHLIKDTAIAAESSLKYQKDFNRLIVLEAYMKGGLSTPERRREYTLVKDSIARNPLKDFIEAGMMPTVVNDIDYSNNIAAYKTDGQNWVDSKTDKLPNGINTAGNFLMMSPGTALHSFFSTATQQSDLVFRYAVYMQEKRKGASESVALQKGREMFIEYDVPSHKGLQFTNDMGPLMYTKYAFRIQRIIWHLMKTKKVALLGETFISDLIGQAPPIMSMNMAYRISEGQLNTRAPMADMLGMFDEAMPIALIREIL